MRYSPQILQAPAVVTSDVSLAPGPNHVEVALDDRFEGQISAEIIVYLKTEAGNLQASDPVTIEYQRADSTDSAEAPHRIGFFSRIWEWIVALFSF